MNTRNGHVNGDYIKDEYKGAAYDSDDGKSPEQIESEIEQTRAEMGHTLDEIQRKLSPGQMVDEALAYIRGSGAGNFAGGFASNFGATVRDNPVPVTLLGVGLAWLMISGRRATRGASGVGFAPDDPSAIMSHDYGNPSVGASVGEAVSGITGAASGAGQRMADAAHGVSDRLSSMGDRVSDMAGSARERASRVSDKAREVSERARDQYYRTKGGIQDLAHEQPLVLAALGVALGATLAALLPATRREDEFMGSTRDELVDAGKEQLQGAKQTLKDVARKTRDDLKHGASAAPGEESEPRQRDQPMAM